MNKELLQKILALEEKLLSPEVRGSVELLNELLAADFVETGVSGKKYQRSDVIRLLAQEPMPPPITITDFEILELSLELVMATYKTIGKEPDDIALRCSIWEKKSEAGWRMRYHHGNRVELNSCLRKR